jgi:hypothetical protein
MVLIRVYLEDMGTCLVDATAVPGSWYYVIRCATRGNCDATQQTPDHNSASSDVGREFHFRHMAKYGLYKDQSGAF